MTRTSAPARSSDTNKIRMNVSLKNVRITTADLYRAGWASSLGRKRKAVAAA
jgi:hypothetical protein